MTKVLIVEGRFDAELADMLLAGARAALDEAGCEHDTITVPGSLEVPAVIAMAAGLYDAYVALGTVVNGSTLHSPIVAQESIRKLVDLAATGLPIGNGIVPANDREQALERVDPARHDRGAEAAHAALALLDAKRSLDAMRAEPVELRAVS